LELGFCDLEPLLVLWVLKIAFPLKTGQKSPHTFGLEILLKEEMCNEKQNKKATPHPLPSLS
jgi:hypothetical protein